MNDSSTNRPSWMESRAIGRWGDVSNYKTIWKGRLGALTLAWWASIHCAMMFEAVDRLTAWNVAVIIGDGILGMVQVFQRAETPFRSRKYSRTSNNVDPGRIVGFLSLNSLEQS